MNVPQLRFNGFGKEWKLIGLNSIATSLIGLTYSPDDVVDKDNGVLVLRSSNIQNGSLNFGNNVYVNKKIPEKLLVNKGDILLCVRNGSRALIGKAALIEESNPKMTFGAFMSLIRSEHSLFIFQLFQTSKFKEQLHENIGATINQITTKDINNFKFYMPVEKEEMDKIASFLLLLDKKNEKQQKKIEKLEQFKRGIMQKVFSQELRFRDKDGEEFGEWEERALNSFTKRVVRKNKGIQSTRPLTISAQQGLVDQKEFFNKNVASANTEGYYLLKKGEFAYNKSYSNGYPWGAIKRLDNYEDGVLSTLYICFEPLANSDSDFLSIYFESTFWYKEVSLISGEGARNHGLLNIGVNDFFETKHKMPSIEEQRKIASALMQLNKKIEKEKEKLMVLEEQKKGFMQVMFV